MLFLAIGWVVIGLGTLGVLAALFVDRSRGRRRCPRCHYDLAHTEGLACPECGRAHAHEGRLYLTRRHWGLACVAFVVALVGVSLLYVPRVQKHGWARVTPTWALIASFERLDNLGPGWTTELTARLRLPTTTDRARRSLLNRAIRIAGDDDADPADRVRAIRVITDSEDPNGAPFYGAYPNSVPYASRVSAFNDAFDRAYDALLSATLDDDVSVQHAAGVAMGAFYSSFGAPKPGNSLPTRHAYPAMAALLVTPGVGSGGGGFLGSGFFSAVGQRSHGVWRVLHGPDVERPLDPVMREWADHARDRDASVARLCEDADHRSWPVAVLATWGLLALDAGTPETIEALGRASRHAQPDVRETAVVVAEQLAGRGYIRYDAAFFVAMLADPDERVRGKARGAILGAEPMPVEGFAIIFELLDTPTVPPQRSGLAWAEHVEEHLEEWHERGMTPYDPALLEELRARVERARKD